MKADIGLDPAAPEQHHGARAPKAGMGMPKNFHGNDLDWQDCKFLFIFCPNNSGTTILSQYIASQLDAYLPPFGNFEGQMAPGVKPMMRLNAWDETREFDWLFIRTRWEALAKGRLFVEASPPNLLRPRAIVRYFGDDATAVTSLSDPYQHTASCLRRYGKPGTKVGGIVRSWVIKAKAISGIRGDWPHFPFLPYERFVAQPRSVNDALSLPVRPFEGPGKKGSDAEGIQDLSPRTTAFLEPDEIDRVTELLTPHAGLLEPFGYRLWEGHALHTSLEERTPQEFAKGRDRRNAWNEGAAPA